MQDMHTDARPGFDLVTLPARLDRIATPPERSGVLGDCEAVFLTKLAEVAQCVMRADDVVCYRFDEKVRCLDDVGASTKSTGGTRSCRVRQLAESAARSGHTEVDRSKSCCLVATASPRASGGWDVLVTVLDIGRSAVDSFVVVQQLITSAIPLWQARVAQQTACRQQRHSSWVNAVGESVERSETMSQLATTVIDAVAIHVRAYQAAFCLQRGGNAAAVDVLAVGGHGHPVDDALWQATASEMFVRGGPTRWPAEEADDRAATIAHRNLAHVVSLQHEAVSVPLVDETGQPFAAMVVLSDDGDRVLRDLSAAGDALQRFVSDWRKNHQTLLDRILVSCTRLLRSRGRMLLLAVAVAMIAMLPVPYRVSTTATVVPRTRSFVVVPHAGLLQETNVRVGDVVQRGMLVATLDDRELRMELATLLAQRDRAAKRRDILRASSQVAEEQLAQYELDGVNEQIKLTRHRLDHLAVVSPIDGVVIAGQLEGVSGAPVETGELLAEIARLDRLWIELDVPEDELAEIDEGRPVRVVFDAVDGRVISTQIESILPSAQTRGGDTVFVARASVANPQGMLRPGIRGTAKISSDSRPLAAVMLRQVWRRVSRFWF